MIHARLRHAAGAGDLQAVLGEDIRYMNHKNQKVYAKNREGGITVI